MANHIVNLSEVRRGLSADRLQPYLDTSDGHLATALTLYKWNAYAAAAFWTDLAHAEVFLRNAIDERLGAWVPRPMGEPWYNALGSILNAKSLEDIAKAKRRVRAEGKPLVPCRVLAAFSFGFWRFLLSSRYDRTLWRPCLHRAFPYSHASRRVVHDTLHRLHSLRNRIAHHEPIHNRDLKAHYDDILTAVGWISPMARAWVEDGSSVPKALSRKPGTSRAC